MKKKRILEFLKETARTSEDVISFIVGASFSRRPGFSAGAEAYRQLQKQRAKNVTEEMSRRERKRVRYLIRQLKNDGLIETSGRGLVATYEITREGKRWLSEKQGIGGTLEKKHYESIPNNVVTIVAYDIPDKYKRFRDWLRGELIAIGLTMLQRSVFIGKIKIPEQLLEDLEEHHLIDFVEIFEITKAGTLRLARKDLRAKI